MSFEIHISADPSFPGGRMSGTSYAPRLNEEFLREQRKKAHTRVVFAGVIVLISVVGISTFVAVLGSDSIGSGILVFGVVFMILGTCGAGLVYIFSRYTVPDTRQVPDEPLFMAEAIELVQDEIWREPTNLRYLEELKEIIQTNEERAVDLHRKAETAFRKLHAIKSYSEYEDAKFQIDGFAHFRSEYERRMPQLKERANKVFASEVIEEINALRADIKKLQRERQDVEDRRGKAGEEETIRAEQRRPFAAAWAATMRDQLKDGIKDIDLEIIQLEAHISELKDFDFKKLYKTLGLPRDWMLMSVEELGGIVAKKDLINSMKPKPPKPTSKEVRSRNRAECQERSAELRRDKAADLAGLRAAGASEEEIKLRENKWDDAIYHAEEEVGKWL